MISIHALLAESDAKGSTVGGAREISIHALLAESDGISVCMCITWRIFLSTLSLRRATWKGSEIICRLVYFYPRSPCGERRQATQAASTRTGFLSTLSLRRATDKLSAEQQTRAISIHALLAESDTIFAVRPYDAPIFLSTLSLRRATLKSPCTIIDPEIFLSTLSLRRATAFRSPRIALIVDFYPRSPCGERPR